MSHIEERAQMKRFCATLRAIHREIRVEFDRRDQRYDWSYSLKGVTALQKAVTPINYSASNHSHEPLPP
jgi:hypothetical protein